MYNELKNPFVFFYISVFSFQGHLVMKTVIQTTNSLTYSCPNNTYGIFYLHRSDLSDDGM